MKATQLCNIFVVLLTKQACGHGDTSP